MQTDVQTESAVSRRPAWRKFFFRPALLNILEHGITRGSDALTSLALIWSLPTETYGKLAFAQAMVAPLGFLFISQDMYIYRNYAAWKARGARSLAHAYRVIDRIVQLKVGFALVLSAAMAICSLVLIAIPLFIYLRAVKLDSGEEEQR